MSDIVISDPVALRDAIQFAEDQGCTDQLARGLLNLLRSLTVGMTREGQRHAMVYKDFAPHSFTFAIWDGDKSRVNLVMNGGLVYDGPTAPGDGSFPSLSVNLNRIAGTAPKHSWNVHT